jgi:hypothetical protein
MKLWVDDVRPAPDGYVWCHSVNETIDFISWLDVSGEYFDLPITLVDVDHDAGDYACDGGDYIKFLDYCEECWGRDLPFAIRIHSMNPVGIANMRAIIQKNGWKEVF